MNEIIGNILVVFLIGGIGIFLGYLINMIKRFCGGPDYGLGKSDFWDD